MLNLLLCLHSIPLDADMACVCVCARMTKLDKAPEAGRMGDVDSGECYVNHSTHYRDYRERHSGERALSGPRS